jgi:hypothetical protein
MEKYSLNGRVESDRSQGDERRYVPYPEGWQARIKQGFEKEYCFSKNPGEEFFHLLMGGEIYLQHGSERYCLNCAVRHGITTPDRMFWQHPPNKPTLPPPV